MVGFQNCGSFFFFVSVPESLAGLDGREQQLQYQALLSFTADWIRRRPSCSMPTPLPYLSHRDFFFLRAWAKRIFFSFFFWTKHKRLFFGIPKPGIKAFCLRTNVLSPRGQRSVPAGGPSGTAGKVISERTSTGHLSCLFFYRDVCLVGSPSELIASKRALWTARSQFWWRLTPKMGPNRAVIVLVMPFASLANLASLCWGGASYAQLNKPLIIPRFENVASF